MGITSRPLASSQLNPSTPKTCDAFAEAACRDAFRDRDLRFAREPEFLDHPPRRLGEVITKVVAETGEKALRRWLNEAAQAESEQERRNALETAQNIAKALGVTLADFIFGRAA